VLGKQLDLCSVDQRVGQVSAILEISGDEVDMFEVERSAGRLDLEEELKAARRFKR
jgi:hypothetical protein